MVQALEEQSRMTETTTLTTEWNSAGPLHHKVETPRNPGESAADHAARHKVDVDALVALYPPIPDNQ
jgi:hypothetical protein